MEGLRDHSDQRAASFLYHRYFKQLVERLKHRINRQVRAVSDSEDTAQFVLAEVLTKLEKGRYPGLEDRNSLWALMITIGDQRTRQVWRDSTAGKRDVRRTMGLGSPRVAPGLEAEVEDMIEYLCKRLKHKEYRKLLVWELQGYSPREIKQLLEDELGKAVADTTLRRWRRSMRDELRAAYPDDCAGSS